MFPISRANWMWMQKTPTTFDSHVWQSFRRQIEQQQLQRSLGISGALFVDIRFVFHQLLTHKLPLLPRVGDTTVTSEARFPYVVHP